jgi:hypothetical protein
LIANVAIQLSVDGGPDPTHAGIAELDCDSIVGDRPLGAHRDRQLPVWYHFREVPGGSRAIALGPFAILRSGRVADIRDNGQRVLRVRFCSMPTPAHGFNTMPSSAFPEIVSNGTYPNRAEAGCKSYAELARARI